MALTLKPLDETTLDAVRGVVTDRFSPDAFALLCKLLSNPSRRAGDDIGVVALDGETVAGVTGSIVRRLHFGREPLVGIAGGALAMRRDASPALLFPLLKKAHRPRFGSVLFFSNTCSPATVKMKPCVGVKNAGPDTWNRVRYARLRRLPLLHRVLSPKACAREGRVFGADPASGLSVTARSDFAWADAFFARYLQTNDGLVGDRTTRDLTWAFGDLLSAGQCLVLAAESREGVEGYAVVAPCSYDPGRWMVCDAIAAGDDSHTLALLFESAKRGVRKCSSARTLSVLGFPSRLAETIAKIFPRSCPAACNGFMWGFSDAALGERCTAAVKDEKGWFFGPYDGDFCLCRI